MESNAVDTLFIDTNDSIIWFWLSATICA